MKDLFLYYDEGWNARVRNEPYNRAATLDWRDGWRDMDKAPPEDRKPYPGTEADFPNSCSNLEQ